jgi:hypothetical protein
VLLKKNFTGLFHSSPSLHPSHLLRCLHPLPASSSRSPSSQSSPPAPSSRPCSTKARQKPSAHVAGPFLPARAYRRPAPSLACSRLPFRPSATAAARIPAKARATACPCRPLRSPPEGAVMALPSASHSPLALCRTEEEG